MIGLAITSRGVEDTASLEIKELINSECQIKDKCIIFNLDKLEDLCLLCYKAQSVEKVLFLLGCFEFKGIEDLKEKMGKVIGKAEWSDWLNKKTTFRVTCKKADNEGILSEELAGDVGALIIDTVKKSKKYKQKVELDDPDITFLAFIDKNTAYLGIDFSGRDLNKREYKVFAHPASLRSTLAYALVRLSELSKGENLLDPFCYSGEIPIEAALFTSNLPLNYHSKDKFSFLKFKKLKKFDFEAFFKRVDKEIIKVKKPLISCFDPKMMNLNAAKKNAKIAGVNKMISFSRIDTEWLDTKLDKESIDRIVTHPPEFTKTSNRRDIEGIYDEFFYQSNFILKKGGKIALISRSMEMLKRAAEKNNFKAKAEREVWCGKQAFEIGVFCRV
ncbi:methyltransferase [Candidatus Woesearchaeota archaeon]|nr:methyltransferase [Candidatus Woesearchaeota archaeon]